MMVSPAMRWAPAPPDQLSDVCLECWWGYSGEWPVVDAWRDDNGGWVWGLMPINGPWRDGKAEGASDARARAEAGWAGWLRETGLVPAAALARALAERDAARRERDRLARRIQGIEAIARGASYRLVPELDAGDPPA